MTAPSAGAATLTETPRDLGPFPGFMLERWPEHISGPVAGITGASPEADFGASRANAWVFLTRMETLARELEFASLAWVRQVHGDTVASVDGPRSPGFHALGEGDGLRTAIPGTLLVVTVADCVPVFLVDREHDALALLHAGWRGASAGILERAIGQLREAYGSSPESIELHLGPAICGACYEVGTEVFEAFGLPGAGPGPLDLRDRLVEQACGAGLSEDRITRSAWCTRCSKDRFHSHRGNGSSAGRMAAFLGWRTAPEAAAGRGSTPPRSVAGGPSTG